MRSKIEGKKIINEWLNEILTDDEGKVIKLKFGIEEFPGFDKPLDYHQKFIKIINKLRTNLPQKIQNLIKEISKFIENHTLLTEEEINIYFIEEFNICSKYMELITYCQFSIRKFFPKINSDTKRFYFSNIKLNFNPKELISLSREIYWVLNKNEGFVNLNFIFKEFETYDKEFIFAATKINKELFYDETYIGLIKLRNKKSFVIKQKIENFIRENNRLCDRTEIFQALVKDYDIDEGYISRLLVESAKFRLAGKKLYGLSEWGFEKAKPIKKLIEEFLIKNGSADLKSIRNYVVLKRNDINIRSVGMILRAGKFTKTPEGDWSLTND